MGKSTISMVKLPEGIPTNHEVWHPTSPDALPRLEKHPQTNLAGTVRAVLAPFCVQWQSHLSH